MAGTPSESVRKLPKQAIAARAVRIERAFAMFLIAMLVVAYLRFRHIGYLPLPFWPDPQDVYADGYSTAWWAFNGAMYDIWKTVYPPLSFAISKVLADSRCYNADVTYVRDCDWGLWGWALVFYAINAIIAYRCYRVSDRATAMPRTIGLMLGLPMLYAFEHLNLLIFAYTGLFLAFGPIQRSTWVRWLGFAVALNLKVYLLAVLLGQLLKRRWRFVEGVLILTVAIYAASYVYVGNGTPAQIIENILIFSSDPERASGVNFIFYASSYKSMVEFVDSSMPVIKFLGSPIPEFLATFLTILLRTVQGVVLVTLAGVWLRPGIITRTRLAAICYLFVLISNETGGYTAAGGIFFVFFERWQGPARIIALVSAWLLCFAVDANISFLYSHVTNGYFSGRPVWQDLWISAGPFLRPGLIMTMELGLVTATLADLLQDWRTSRPYVETLPA